MQRGEVVGGERLSKERGKGDGARGHNPSGKLTMFGSPGIAADQRSLLPTDCGF